MAREEHVEIIKRGVSDWNSWREANPTIAPDLSGVTLRNSKLAGANLHRTDLSGANLPHADLSGADLSDANLVGARLRNASLSEANLARANLGVTELSEADLSLAVLSDADLVGATLDRATLCDADLSDADLSGARLVGADLTSADLRGSNLDATDLREADLKDAILIRAQLVGTNLERAMLDGCRIYGISAWNVRLHGAQQNDLIITDWEEPEITLDNLEVAQFIHLLLRNERIRGVIDTITTKVVLILGRFTRERKAILDAIRQLLRKDNYIPILFDFGKPATRDTHETITTLARMAKFVIADISDPRSIPQELVSIVEQLPSLPVQPIAHRESAPWGMYDHIRHYPWVLQLHRYHSSGDLLSDLGTTIIPRAEAKVREIRRER